MDKEKLEEAMRRNGVSKVKMCELIGISRSSFYRKCMGTTEFTQSEIQKIVDFLGLDSPVDIFCKESVLKDTSVQMPE